ncbi:hypothetical protein DXG01_014445 [Tephrocybe rancida]|nr:hypothetical protein DXG01_014445 [Tephrocybe rancida]
MLLPNVVYQFFFAPQSEPDPEKGTQNDVESEPAEGSRGVLNTYPTASSAAENDGVDDTMEEIDQEDDNEIIDELEHEEFPENSRTTRRRHFSISTTLTSVTSSSWWSRFKGMLDPHTSPADLEAYVPHYRYMPIISGVIIPFSILLEIPGLTEDWYIRTENHQVVEIRKNPVILDTGLGFSIAFAALANICLVVRFMEKRIKMMTLLCVMFLTIHDVINIVAVTVFGVEHRFDDGFTYGQAFWMTVCSTSVSTITNITLIIDLVRTPNFARSGSGLTRKQRTLVISVMALLVYIAFGALVTTFLLKLSFLDALYFTVVSIETVGFGDIVPETTGARFFTCIYSMFGIISIALTVGLTRETVLEAIEVGYRRRVRAVRQRRRAAQFERRVVQRWTAAIEWRLRKAGLPVWVHDKAGRDHAHESAHRYRHWIRQHLWPWTKKGSRYTRYFQGHSMGRMYPKGMHLNLEDLSWLQLESAAMEAGVPLYKLLPEGFQPRGQSVRESERAVMGAGDGSHEDGAGNEKVSSKGKGKAKERDNNLRFQPSPILQGENSLPLTHARLGSMILMLGNFALAMDEGSFVKVPKLGSDAAKAKRRRESPAAINVGGHPASATQPIAERYEAFRSTMIVEERKAFWVRFWLVWLIFLGFWMVGSAIFMATDKWTMGQALYFFLSEAYSSRYKRIFSSGLVTQAVKRYQQRARDAASERRHFQSASLTLVSAQGPDTGTTYVQQYSPVSAGTLAPPIPLDAALSDSRKRVTGHLEALPAQVLQHARTFGEEAQFLIEPGAVSMAQSQDGVPEGLKKLMDDVTGIERLGERIKEEILGDADARHALLAISIENVLRKIMEIAEEAIEAVKERDRLAELKTVDFDSQTSPETGETDGVRYRQSFVQGDGA